MARIARIVAPSVPRHITQRGNRLQSPFFWEISMVSPELPKGFDISVLVKVEKVTGRDLSKGRPGRPRKAEGWQIMHGKIPSVPIIRSNNRTTTPGMRSKPTGPCPISASGKALNEVLHRSHHAISLPICTRLSCSCGRSDAFRRHHYRAGAHHGERQPAAHAEFRCQRRG